jgi:hypothetical protein
VILGILLGCTIPTDVSSCDVVAYEKKRFSTMDECKIEMSNVARYAADNFRIMARPYCFQVNIAI